ncbi:MAG: transposase [Patescibacteria group bacterium]|nr:transposase [Patescibacteria group bacterium]
MEKLPYRKTKRLKGFNYSESGFYFITICTNGFKHYFGEVKNQYMFLNEAGCMLYRNWENLEKEFESVIPQEFIVMPNHIHGIIELRNGEIGTDNHPTASFDREGHRKGHPYTEVNKTLGDVVGAFKSRTTGEYIKMVKNKLCLPFPGKLWQKNYYERIIDNEKDYDNIAEYIIYNPNQWLKGSDKYG